MKRIFVLFTVMLSPLLATFLIYNDSSLVSSLVSTVAMSATVLGAVLLVVGLSGNTKVNIFVTVLLVFYYLLFLAVSVIEAGVFDFTGKGFSEEFFFHFEPQAVKVAFNEYFWTLTLLILGLLVMIVLIFILAQSVSRKSSWILMLLGLLFVIVAIPYSALGRMINVWYQYQQDDVVNFDKDTIEKFESLGILNVAKPSSSFNFEASSSHQSKNLILVYLESFNQGFLNHPRHLGLTPRINQLSKEMTSINTLSSSYVTIEGIIASQCGIMLPMSAGSNTFLNSGQLMNYMPCLGDVLKKAGYRQYYLGGTVMEFAGKGSFLSSHGYDVIRGWRFWQNEKGYSQHQGGWGLSDSKLFEEAINTIREAAENPPYNVTLLTLGTHLPGFSYQGCQDYKDGRERFLNAIHCTDHLLGAFVDTLKKEQLLDNTLLMIVADHGVFPTKKMNSLFAEMVSDRTLLTLFNQPLSLPEIPEFAGYDIAPTLLDLLQVEHNVDFLYGQSLFAEDKNKQQYVTRYYDWDNGKLVDNQPGSCAEQPSWPLNNCHKKLLINYTNQVISNFSRAETKEKLPCELNILLQHNQADSKLLVNNQNHFSNFYHKGFKLNPKKIKMGIWGLSISADNELIDYIYFADDLSEVKRFKDYVAKTNNRHLWVAHSNSAEFLQQIGAKQGTGTQFMQTDQAHNMTWSFTGHFNTCSSKATK